MNERKYFLLSLLLSTGLSLNADNRANPRKSRANRLEAEVSIKAELALTDKENELLVNNPDDAFAYMPEDTRKVLLDMQDNLMLSEDVSKHIKDYSIINYDLINNMVSKIIEEDTEKSFLNKEAFDNLSEYKKALSCGDALVIADIRKVGTRTKVNSFCNLSVKKKLKAEDIYVKNLYINGVPYSQLDDMKYRSYMIVSDATAAKPGFSFTGSRSSGFYFIPAGSAANTQGKDAVAISVDGVNVTQFSTAGLYFNPATFSAAPAGVTTANVVVDPSTGLVYVQ